MAKIPFIADIDCSISEHGREVVFLKAGITKRIDLDEGIHKLNIYGLSYGKEYANSLECEEFDFEEFPKEIKTELLFKQISLIVVESIKYSSIRRIESSTMSKSGLTAYLSEVQSGVNIIIYGENRDKSFHEIVVPSKCTFNRKIQNIVSASVNQIVGNVYLPEDLTDFSFNSAEGIKYVYLPDTIKTIPKRAFAESGIENIHLPYCLEEIADGAFEDCRSLKQIIIPPHLQRIGYRAFAGCKALFDVVCLAAKVSIDGYAFEDCTNIKNVIADSLDSWCLHDFKNSLSNPVSYSHKLCIRNVQVLGNLIIPKTVTRIKKYAFSGLESLNSIIISGTVQSIEEDAFYHCINIKKIIIEEGTLVLGKEAFRNLSQLRRIDLPRSIKTIERDAFRGCEKLMQINHTGDIKSWCEIQFDNNYSNPVIYSHKLRVASKDIIGELVIPDDVQKISQYAFTCCDGITSIVVSEKVSENGKNAFDNCSSITSIELKEGCKTVWEGAFANLHNLSKVILPDSLISIEDKAFYNCVSLESLHIPENVKVIGDSAFESCSQLSSLIIPERVEKLGDFVFIDCTNLKDILLSSQLKSIGSFAFARCINLKKIELPLGIETIGDGAFSDCKSIKSVMLPNSIKLVPNLCFSGCDRLKIVILGNGIECIGKLAFSSCAGITEISINSSNWPKFEYQGSGRGDNYREDDPFGLITYSERNYHYKQNIVKFYIYCDEKRIMTMPEEWERHCKEVIPLSESLGSGC
ncbi:MAG: leucine-rich repeat domain-containing protein [Bacteroidales bacterium]|nr:leucine-rich repeat domain-containing protein [Bacteroidales bacterium]